MSSVNYFLVSPPRGTSSRDRKLGREYPTPDIWKFRSPTRFTNGSSNQKGSTFCCKSMQGFCRACSELALACATFSIAASVTFTISRSRQQWICKLQFLLYILSLTCHSFTGSSSMIWVPPIIGSDLRYMHTESELCTLKQTVSWFRPSFTFAFAICAITPPFFQA